MIDTYLNDISEIMKYYGLSDFDIDLPPVYKYRKISERLAILLSYSTDEPSRQNISRSTTKRQKEVAEFIQFLRACEGSPLTIYGRITRPTGKQIVGKKLTMTITNQQFLTWLELFANTYFSKQLNGFFEATFGWDFKKPLTMREGLAPVYEEEQDPFFTEPFSDEEISQIIHYYNEQEGSAIKFTNLGRLGRIAQQIVNCISSNSECTHWTQRKLYSFTYDIMLLAGFSGETPITDKGFSGETGREKAQEVHNWLNAHNRDKKKSKNRSN